MPASLRSRVERFCGAAAVDVSASDTEPAASAPHSAAEFELQEALIFLIAAFQGSRDDQADTVAGVPTPIPLSSPWWYPHKPQGEEASLVAMEVDQGMRAAPCIAPDEVD